MNLLWRMRDAKVGAFLAGFGTLCFGAYVGFLALKSILNGDRQTWNWIFLGVGIWWGCGAIYLFWKFLEWLYLAPWKEIMRDLLAAAVLLLSYWILIGLRK